MLEFSFKIKKTSESYVKFVIDFLKRLLRTDIQRTTHPHLFIK